MPTLEVAADDLVLVIPQDAGDPSSSVRVLVGDRPVNHLRELHITVGVARAAEVRAVWPELNASAIPSGLPGRILAAQTLISPWLNRHPAVENGRPTLWSRLEDE
jgi:hypothetical protein